MVQADEPVELDGAQAASTISGWSRTRKTAGVTLAKPKNKTDEVLTPGTHDHQRCVSLKDLRLIG